MKNLNNETIYLTKIKLKDDSSNFVKNSWLKYSQNFSFESLNNFEGEIYDIFDPDFSSDFSKTFCEKKIKNEKNVFFENFNNFEEDHLEKNEKNKNFFFFENSFSLKSEISFFEKLDESSINLHFLSDEEKSDDFEKFFGNIKKKYDFHNILKDIENKNKFDYKKYKEAVLGNYLPGNESDRFDKFILEKKMNFEEKQKNSLKKFPQIKDKKNNFEEYIEEKERKNYLEEKQKKLNKIEKYNNFFSRIEKSVKKKKKYYFENSFEISKKKRIFILVLKKKKDIKV